MRFFILFFFGIFFINASYAQAANRVDENYNGWYMYFGDHRLSERWGIHTDYQFRRSDYYAHWQQSLTRVGLNYHTKGGPVYSFGYTWIYNWPYGKQPIAYPLNEHQAYEQLVLTQSTGRFYFNHRYRLEQRFIETKKQVSVHEFEHVDYIFRNRMRYRFMINVPLSKAKMEAKTLYLSVFDELWVNFGEGVGENHLDQNWAYAALGWKFTENLSLEAGYLNQYLLKADGDHAENNHTLQLSLHYNLDFRK